MPYVQDANNLGYLACATMPIENLKANLEILLAAVVAAASRTGRELRQMQGIALYDPEKDLFIQSLESYVVVEVGIRELPLVQDRYGGGESHRLTLQLVYEYFDRANTIAVDSSLVDALWTDFVAELESPIWLARTVTNLRHFHSDDHHVELTDGVSIYGRNRAVLTQLGFSDSLLEALFADWGRWGASSFVLVTEHAVAKKPDNFVMVDDGGGWLRSMRSLGAMRLTAPGDVGISAVFQQRVARFNVGIGGILSNGMTVNTKGNPFAWRSELRVPCVTTYACLAHLEKAGYGTSRGNLDLALRAFMSTFDRFPTVPDTQLVDAITALEAILGGETEIAFKLSFRVASLLAATDEQRVALLKAVKGFYTARSKIVHGVRLSPKHSAALAAVDDLRDIVRTILRGFVLFAADASRQVDAKLFSDEHLDASLVDTTQREKLRRLLGLSE